MTFYGSTGSSKKRMNELNPWSLWVWLSFLRLKSVTPLTGQSRPKVPKPVFSLGTTQSAVMKKRLKHEQQQAHHHTSSVLPRRHHCHDETASLLWRRPVLPHQMACYGQRGFPVTQTQERTHQPMLQFQSAGLLLVDLGAISTQLEHFQSVILTLVHSPKALLNKMDFVASL